MTHKLHEGYNVIETAQQAGHGPEMTLNVYGHVLHEVDPTQPREPIADRALRARRALEEPKVNPKRPETGDAKRDEPRPGAA